MTRKRVILILISLLAYGVIIFLVYLWVMPPLSHGSRLEDEQEIYSSLINEYDVLTDTTIIGWSDYSKDDLEYIKRGLPELEDETFADFQERDSSSYLLKDYFPSPDHYIFLDSLEIEQIYQDGWAAFDSKYPYSHGITSFSRIGFNSRYTQALVFKEYGSPEELGSDSGSYGEGTFILLEKVNGVWSVIRELLMWIT